MKTGLKKHVEWFENMDGKDLAEALNSATLSIYLKQKAHQFLAVETDRTQRFIDRLKGWRNARENGLKYGSLYTLDAIIKAFEEGRDL